MFAYFLPLGACTHHCCTRRDLQSCEIIPNTIVVWPSPCIGGNETRDVLARSLIVKTVGAVWERPSQRSTHTWRRSGGYPQSYPNGSLALARSSLREVPIRTRESLRASQYLGKNTGVIDGSLHISTLLFSFRIYIVCITLFAVEIATH